MKPIALRNYALTLAVLVSGAAVAVGQLGGTLSGPVIGYFFSVSDRTVLPLQGVPGSATIGPAVNLGYAVDWALTLDARHLIVSSGSSPNLLNVNLESMPPVSTPIPVPAGPSASAASPRGNTAAFYVPGKGMYIVTGLPKAPSVRTVNLGRGDHPVTRVAVSFDGGLLVYSEKDEDGESIYSWTASSGPGRLLASAKAVGGMVVTSNGGVVVADRGVNEVFAVWDVRGTAQREFLADTRSGVSAPSGVAVSARNDIYVTNASSVLALDSAGRVKHSQACGCAPSGIYWLKDSLFRLTDRGDQTVYLMDAGAEDRIFFVPPPLVTP